MYLESIEIFNFRGIRHLAVNFEQGSTVLIGENTWGKTSLLALLWEVLGTGQPCSFEKSDLYVPVRLAATKEQEYEKRSRQTLAVSRPGLIQGFCPEGLKEDNLQSFLADRDSSDVDFVASDVFFEKIEGISIRLIFCEAVPGLSQKSSRLRRLGNAWQLCDDGFYRVFYHIQAEEDDKGSFVTSHKVTSIKGTALEGDHAEIIRLILDMNPVLRMRDSRMEPNVDLDDNLDEDGRILLELTSRIASFEDAAASGGQLKSDIETINLLSTKYLASYGGNVKFNRKIRHGRKGIRDLVTKPLSLESLTSLSREIRSSEPTREKFLLIFLTAALYCSKGARDFDHKARPIVILEDVEGRFHPSVLLSFWSVIESLPVQKIVTTNSCDLLTSVPLSCIRRLCREYYDTRSYQINENHFNADDLRRIAFHIRINRPIALFARLWVLVEGETEMWLIPEIAAIMGYSLSCAGIRLVEFAQCGLAPLLKLARSLGITAFVITDGDEAGRRYAQTVRLFTKSRIEDRLLILPALDIEHYLYANGYEKVFLECAGAAGQYHNKKQLTSSKIIAQAIRKKTKPGLALAVLNEMHQRSISGIPGELRDAVNKIIAISRQEMALD